jgi:hypothetical protein
MLIAPVAGNWLFEHAGGTALWLIAGGSAVLASAGFWLMRGRMGPGESRDDESIPSDP